MEAMERRRQAFQKHLVTTGFAQLLLGILTMGLAFVLIGNVQAENPGHPIVFTGAISVGLAVMAMVSGRLAQLVAYQVPTPTKSLRTLKCYMTCYASLCLLSFLMTLTGVAWSGKSAVDCLHGAEACSPHPLRKSVLAVVLAIVDIALFLTHCQGVAMFGRYEPQLGLQERLAFLFGSKDIPGSDEEQGQRLQQQEGDQESNDESQQTQQNHQQNHPQHQHQHQHQQLQEEDEEEEMELTQKKTTRVPYRGYRWEPPSYEEAVNMIEKEEEGGVASREDAGPACQLEEEEEPPKYEDVVAESGNWYYRTENNHI